jgi:hypothetical protein
MCLSARALRPRDCTCVEEIMKQFCLGIVVAIGLTLPAFADSPNLKGDYAFTYNDFCLQSPSGFNANLTPLAGPVNGASSGATGFEHFNGDGTGTVQIIGDIGITLASTPLGSSAGTSTGSLQFTYTFNPNGTFTMNVVPGTFVGTLGSGLTFSINPGFSWLGFVSNDAKMHTLTAVTPSVQTITINTSPPIKVPSRMWLEFVWRNLRYDEVI